MKIQGQLISSQRYLNETIVLDKALRFKVFIIEVIPMILRGKQYTLLVNGHHNYAAAKLAGVVPQFRIPKKASKALNSLTQSKLETFVINNLTDSHIYDVNTGEVVMVLVNPDTNNMAYQRELVNVLKLY